MKKLISILLSAVILLGVFPQNMTVKAADAQTDLESIIREQIEAFAKSIDQKNAVNKAAKALASHGISSGGKKLSVGKSHALTATLMNSELALETIIKSCQIGIRFMQRKGLTSCFARAGCNWSAKELTYTPTILNSDYIYEVFSFSGTANSYDNALIWMTGSTPIYIDMPCGELTQGEIVYNITVKFQDRFDFNTRHGTGFQNLISGIGALLFREFDWESKVTFQLTAPNECEHSYKTKTTKPTCTAKGYTTYTCSLCGYSYKADYTAKKQHAYDDANDASCNLCGELRAVRGDMNGDFKKDAQDALYLLRHMLLPKEYPLK